MCIGSHLAFREEILNEESRENDWSGCEHDDRLSALFAVTTFGADAMRLRRGLSVISVDPKYFDNFLVKASV